MARILLVEDDPDLRLALSVRLTASGFQCDTASDGKEALDKIGAQLPDLIVADLIMPVMDGYELVRRVRANPHTRATPILVISALTPRAKELHLEELQGVHLLHKPFDAEEFLSSIRALLAPQPSGG